MSQPPHQPPQDGSSWNQQPGQYGPPPGQYGPPPGQYGQPAGQYGPPPGQYGTPPSGGSGNGKVIGIVAAVVVVVAAVVLVLVFTVFKKDDDTRADGALSSAEALASQLSSAVSQAQESAGEDSSGDSGSGASGGAREPGPLVDATVPPDGLGDDDTLDGLAQNCFDGDMQSCDDLFLQSDVGSAYETYGDTCAGRQPAYTGQYCTVTFPDA